MVLRIGLVGAGVVGQRHAQVIDERASRCALVAVADPHTQAAAALAEPRGAHVHDSGQSLLAAGAVDAVVLATPNAAHREDVCAAAAAGVHVLVEKPLAETIADCDAMVGAADRAGIVLAVGHMQRCLPEVLRARDLLDRGTIGRPRLVVEYRSGRYEPGTRPPWFLDGDAGGGGIVTNLGAHCVDKLTYLTGGGFTVHHAWTDGRTVPTEAVALLETDGGVRVSLTLVGTGTPNTEVTEIVGTEGSLRLSSEGIAIYRRGELGESEPPPAGRVTTAFTTQFAAFIDAIQSGGPPVADGRYGRDVVRVLREVLHGGESSRAAGPS